MDQKLPLATKEIMAHYILDYVAGNMAKPLDIKIDFEQEYIFNEKDFFNFIDELIEFELLDKRGDYLSLTLRGRFLLKESPDQISLKALEQMKEIDPTILVRPKINQKPIEMFRWYGRVLKYFPINTHQMIYTVIVLFLLILTKFYFDRSDP